MPSASCAAPPKSATAAPTCTTTHNHVTALSSLGEAGASRGPVRTMTGVSSVPVEATMPPKACAAPSKPFRVASGPTGPKPEHTCRTLPFESELAIIGWVGVSDEGLCARHTRGRGSGP